MSVLTEDEIKKFVATWFLALDSHVPIEQAYSLLADEGLNMQFPDGDIRDYASMTASQISSLTKITMSRARM
jgi:hypothetical protein